MADEPQDDRKPTDSGERLDPVRLIAENGSAEAAVRALAFKLNDVERDNAKYRADIKTLKDAVPPEGARVLTPEQAAEFDAFAADLRAHGIEDAATLKAFAETAGANAAKVAAAERKEQLAEIAAITDTNADAIPDVFASGETFEIRGEGDNRTVYVRPTPEAEAAEFGAYVDANKAPLKPALYNKAEEPPRAPTLPAMPTGGPPGPQRLDVARIAEQKAASGDYAMI
ncbi:MAG: hypothetical protein ACPG5O_10065 [Pseudoalteromonas tetraodonis]